MNQVILTVKFLFWACISCFFAYRLIDENNHLTEVRKEIPLKEKTLKLLKEENSRLLYTIETQENPIRLMELSRDKQFSHLKFPKQGDVIKIEKPALNNAKATKK